MSRNYLNSDAFRRDAQRDAVADDARNREALDRLDAAERRYDTLGYGRLRGLAYPDEAIQAARREIVTLTQWHERCPDPAYLKAIDRLAKWVKENER